MAGSIMIIETIDCASLKFFDWKATNNCSAEAKKQIGKSNKSSAAIVKPSKLKLAPILVKSIKLTENDVKLKVNNTPTQAIKLAQQSLAETILTVLTGWHNNISNTLRSRSPALASMATGKPDINAAINKYRPSIIDIIIAFELGNEVSCSIILTACNNCTSIPRTNKRL